MARRPSDTVGNAVGLSALDLFSNALGAVAFLLLLFAVNALNLVREVPLKILTKRLPAATAETEYVAVLAAAGGAPPYRWSLRSGSPPEGLTLNGQGGEIAGTAAAPNAGQVFPLEILVQDAREHSARARFDLRVTPRLSDQDRRATPLVLLTHGPLPHAAVDRSYQLYLSARGGSGKYRWSARGAPPELVVESSSGLLRGVPRAPGEYELVLRVEDEVQGSGDAAAAVATAWLEIRSAPGEQVASAAAQPPPLILTRKLPPAVQSQPYQITLAGQGVHPLHWSAKNLPTGLAISEEGAISGTPVSDADGEVVVTMSDARSKNAPKRSFTLVVKPRPRSIVQRVNERGIWGWLGYLLLALANVAFLFVLRRQEGRRIEEMMRRHNVTIIKKPDGTASLSGPKDNVSAFQADYKSMHRRYTYSRRMSYAVLAGLMIVYTLFLVV